MARCREAWSSIRDSESTVRALVMRAKLPLMLAMPPLTTNRLPMATEYLLMTVSAGAWLCAAVLRIPGSLAMSLRIVAALDRCRAPIRDEHARGGPLVLHRLH